MRQTIPTGWRRVSAVINGSAWSASSRMFPCWTSPPDTTQGRAVTAAITGQTSLGIPSMEDMSSSVQHHSFDDVESQSRAVLADSPDQQ